MAQKTAECPLCGAVSTDYCSMQRCEWKPPIITSITDAGEVTVTMPSGRIVFMGFWEAVKFTWGAIFKGHDVQVEK